MANRIYEKAGALMRTDLGGPVLALWCLTALPGCSTEPFCEEFTKCGGDFTAGKQVMGDDAAASVKWVAGPTDACIDQVPNPRLPLHHRHGAPV